MATADTRVLTARAGVEQDETRYRMTLEALADVAAGRCVAHAEVEKWTKSLSTKRLKPLPTCT